MSPKLIVHGGAGQWANFDEAAVLAGVRAAAAAGWAILQAGGSALDAVEAAVILLEDNPLFDAGIGSFLNEQGEIEMDALIADGREIRFGAVAGVRRVRHPITLARAVMEKTNNCFFVADGADQLAASLGIPLVPNIELISENELATFRARHASSPSRAAFGTGTVGAIALDNTGNLISGTSTGGTPDKKKGRVGDSPIFGAGGYADDQTGAASATGVGENIMRVFLCKNAVDRMANGLGGGAAAQAALDFLSSRIPNPEAGIIVIDSRGEIGAAHTTAAMPIAWVDSDGQVQARMRG